MFITPVCPVCFQIRWTHVRDDVVMEQIAITRASATQRVSATMTAAQTMLHYVKVRDRSTILMIFDTKNMCICHY